VTEIRSEYSGRCRACQPRELEQDSVGGCLPRNQQAYFRAVNNHIHRDEKRGLQARIASISEPGAIEEAAEIIRRGGLVAFPTETVYGLGADSCNPIAIAKIFEVKNRPAFDPIIVHVADPDSAARYGSLESEAARILIDRFWPGPLTVVVPKTETVPPIVTAGLDTVALRMPDNGAALELIRKAGRALGAASANPFGYVSPTEARHVVDQLADRVDLILDGGKCRVGLESTVISLTGRQACILRAGGVPPKEIEEVLGPLGRSTQSAVEPRSPGQLVRHYATQTPLRILEEGAEPCPGPSERVGLLAFGVPGHPERYASVELLTDSGNLREAAANLFAALRRLDNLKLDRLVAHPVPEHGLGVAIMDRLRRCAIES